MPARTTVTLRVSEIKEIRDLLARGVQMAHLLQRLADGEDISHDWLRGAADGWNREFEAWLGVEDEA